MFRSGFPPSRPTVSLYRFIRGKPERYFTRLKQATHRARSSIQMIMILASCGERRDVLGCALVTDVAPASRFLLWCVFPQPFDLEHIGLTSIFYSGCRPGVSDHGACLKPGNLTHTHSFALPNIITAANTGAVRAVPFWMRDARIHPVLHVSSGCLPPAPHCFYAQLRSRYFSPTIK